jgi:O-methyltransferase
LNNECDIYLEIFRIALLHIDADWYDSVKTVLETFFDRVVPGGFVVLDDYGYWQGCDQALTDFFAQRGIKDVPIERVGRQGAYFQKPCEPELIEQTS